MPVQIQLENVQPYSADGQFGHRFTLRIAIPQRSGARLNWIERTDRPYVAGMAPDTWTDMYRLIGDKSDVFSGWTDSEDDEGAVVVTVIDPPSIQQQAYARRTLDFYVGVLDGDGADWAVWQAEQQLEWGSAGAVTQSFNVTASSTGNDGEPPYPFGFSPY